MKNITLIILGLIVIGGGTYYWYTTRDVGEGADSMMTEVETPEGELAIGDGETMIAAEGETGEAAGQTMSTLRALMESGSSLSCTFSRDQDDSNIAGTYNVSGTKVAGNYTITQPNGTVSNFQMISDGQYMYSWGDQLGGYGLKVDLERAKEISAEGQPSATPSSGEPQFDALSEQFQYNCTPWTVDPSVFEVPADVNFMSF